jgi:hypothetical protein
MKGKSIDFDKLKMENETTIAVGNMRVNARGDLIGAGNEVAMGRNAIMDQVYAVPSADTGYSPNDPASFAAHQARIDAMNAQQLNELAKNTTVTPEQAAADNKPAVPVARGTLAGSVAKPTSVVQEPMPKPSEQRRKDGPSRI